MSEEAYAAFIERSISVTHPLAAALERCCSPEEVAELCVDRLMLVSNDAPPVIKDQALAHKERMKAVIAVYMKQAIQSDRTTIYNAISDAGHKKLAEYIRKM